MKILDRHLLRSLLVPLIYCLAAFSMVYVVFDLFNNLGDFVSSRAPLDEVLKFYALLLPSALIYILPVSLLLATLYSLSALTRNNELTAMRACGVSLFRMMTPFLLTGLTASLAVLAINERIAPRAVYWTELFLKVQRAAKSQRTDVLEATIDYRNEPARRSWRIRSFHRKTYELRNIEITQFRENGLDAWKLTAAAGHWLDGQWWFDDIEIQDYDEYLNRAGAPRKIPGRPMTELTETPDDFIKMIKKPEHCSAAELIQYLKIHRSLDRKGVRRTLVDFHSRLALPWACLVVVLLGMPLGSQTGRHGKFFGVMTALLMFFAFWAAVVVGQWLGKQGIIHPWAAGWLPVLLFGLGGAIATARLP